MITACLLAACVNLNFMSLFHVQEVKETDFVFLSGSWEAEIWGGVFEETWSIPKGGTMTHMGRHTRDGKTSFIEFASIEQVEGKWALYIMLGAPSKGAKTPAVFALEKALKGDITFYSPTNDYPTRIRYQGDGLSSMTATLTGREDGKDKSDIFRFKRKKID